MRVIRVFLGLLLAASAFGNTAFAKVDIWRVEDDIFHTGKTEGNSPMAACAAFFAAGRAQLIASGHTITRQWIYVIDGGSTSFCALSVAAGGDFMVPVVKVGETCDFGKNKNIVIPLGWEGDDSSITETGAGYVGGKVCLAGCEVGLNMIKDVFTRPDEPEVNGRRVVYGEYAGVTTGAECDGTTEFNTPPVPDVSSSGSGGSSGGGSDNDPDSNDSDGGDRDSYPGDGDDGDGDSDDPGEAGVNHPGGANNQPNAEATCGVPGKPECTSRIDETGTPTGPGDKMSTEPIGAEFDKLRDQLNRITDKGDKDTSWGVNPSWFASGACEPWNLGEIHGQALNINYCPAVPYAQGAASFAWIVVTFFAVVHLVGAALNVRAA